MGDDAKPFEANLVTRGQCPALADKSAGRRGDWRTLKRLLSEGYSIRDCAEEMGKSKGAIQRLKKKLDGGKLTRRFQVYRCITP